MRYKKRKIVNEVKLQLRPVVVIAEDGLPKKLAASIDEFRVYSRGVLVRQVNLSRPLMPLSGDSLAFTYKITVL